MRRPLFLLLALLLAATLPANASVAAAPPPDLAGRLDQLLAQSYPASEPGVAVLVEKEGTVVLRKGYGMASLELGVPIRPEMVFRIGSITKQFTAMAILELVQQGKLSLDDDITRFLPGYPTHGQRITIENLLTHTSGIKNYTDLAEWRRGDFHGLSVSQLIDRFKDQPVDFSPGEKWLYDKSGYILLGDIVEKITGQAYTGWLAEHVTGPLGMTHTVEAEEDPVVPGRVAGYEGPPGHYRNALHTGHFADGALLSSVDDLALWDRALTAGTLVRKDLLDRMFTPFHLKDGRSTNYGYGWAIRSYEGHRVVEHADIVNGFKTEILRMPEDHLLVVLLSNNLDHVPDPTTLAVEIAALAIGQPLAERKTISLAPQILDRYVGVYRIDAATTRVVTREGNRLFTQRGSYPKLEILPSAENVLGELSVLCSLRLVEPQGSKRASGQHPFAQPGEPAEGSDGLDSFAGRFRKWTETLLEQTQEDLPHRLEPFLQSFLPSRLAPRLQALTTPGLQPLFPALRRDPLRPRGRHRPDLPVLPNLGELSVLRSLVRIQLQVRFDTVHQKDTPRIVHTGGRDPAQAGELERRPVQRTRAHERGEPPGEGLGPREIFGRVAPGKAEGDVAEGSQAGAELVLRQGRDLDASPSPMEIDHDREDLVFMDRLDLAVVAPETPPHGGRGAGLDLDVDEKRAPAVSAEGDARQEVELTTPTPGGEELLVEEHRVLEVEPGRQVRHHEPEEVGEEATEQSLEDRVVPRHVPSQEPRREVGASALRGEGRKKLARSFRGENGLAAPRSQARDGRRKRRPFLALKLQIQKDFAASSTGSYRWNRRSR
jgi:D-alanyl-D-alanine carboxypeptidase